MRKRIYRISEDKFDKQQPHIEFENEKIELSCYVGSIATGSIDFHSTNDVSARGVVYCSTPYVTLSTTQFDGTDVSIEFTVKDLYFKDKESVSGYFTIVTVGLEKDIPFTVTYHKKPLMTSLGEINSFEEFLDYAQKKYFEAMSIFYSDDFAEFVADKPKNHRLIYKAYRNAAKTSANFDEFFVALGLKSKMTFDMEEHTDEYLDVSENIRGEIELTRSTWGFIDIKVSCDADFILLDKTSITSDYFLGSVFTMNYYVMKDKLHAGINYARILFEYKDIKKEIVVVATKDKSFDKNLSDNQLRNRKIIELYRLYEEFRLRRVSTGQWCKDSSAIIEALRNADEDCDNWLLLYKAQTLITNKQRQEALWIIQDLKRSISDKRSAAWAYLLYLCTLIEREESYVDRLTSDIESIYREHSRDVRIFWFLLFLRKEYVKNPTAKLRAIAEWINAGYEAPILYIEAYYVYLQDPYLISSFDDFTIKVLHWAKKHDAITKDVAIQMIHVLESEKKFKPKAMDILDTCYRIYPDLKLLLGIVSYLIKTTPANEKYLDWYKKAIESGLSVSGLYEAYLNTLPSFSMDKLPQVVTMFFRYNNNLAADKKALLYANIILHQDEDKETYKQYERAIELFTIEQLKQLKCDDNLAVCYGQLLKIGIIDGDVAKLFSKLLYTKKLTVSDTRTRRVFLYQEEYVAPEIVTITNSCAYVNVKPGKAKIFLEDCFGNLTVDDRVYRLDDAFESEGYIGKLRENNHSSLNFLLEDIMSNRSASDLDLSYMDTMEELLTSEELSPSYKEQMYPFIIEYFDIHSREELLEKYFMKTANLKTLSAKVISQVLDVFVVRSKYEEAFYLIQNINATEMKTDTANKICQFMVNKKQDEIDDFLILFTSSLIEKDCMRGDMISYLVRNYVGPIRIMMRIFERAVDMNLDIVDFAERILIQSMYEDIMPDNICYVFENYISRKNNKMIVEAFLTYEAHA